MCSQDCVNITNASIVIQSVIRGILVRRRFNSSKVVSLFTTTTIKTDTFKTDDYISAMPDDILSAILSLLNMREAVKTRVLSCRWRYLCFNFELLFDLLTVFGINYNKPFYFENWDKLWERKCKFAEAVDQFLQLYRGPKINSFKLRYCLGNESAGYIDRWISFVVEMQTTKIELRFACLPLDCELYNFPFHLLSQDETSPLKKLRLRSCLLRPSPNSMNCLNSLKFLDLKYITLSQIDIDNISNGCKNLECLRLSKCFLPKILFIRGKFTCLKSLILEIGTFVRNNLERVVISRLNYLTYFDYYNDLTGSVSFKYNKVPCLVKLSLKIVRLQSETINYLLNRVAEDIPNLQSLLIDAQYIVQYIPAQMTKFSHLKVLELLILCSPEFDLLAFTSILNACPLLQRFYMGLIFVRRYFKRTPQEECFRYLHHHLKEVEIAGFYDHSNVMELAKYFLNNAVVLDLMTLNSKLKKCRGGNKWSNIETRNKFTTDKSRQRYVKDVLMKHAARSNVELRVL